VGWWGGGVVGWWGGGVVGWWMYSLVELRSTKMSSYYVFPWTLKPISIGEMSKLKVSTSYCRQTWLIFRRREHWVPFLASPLAPRGELGPQGWNWSPSGNVHPFVHLKGMNTLYCFEEWRGEQRISPPGDNFTHAPGDKIHPLGTTSPMGVKVCP
jgi:hypothetical protein